MYMNDKKLFAKNEKRIGNPNAGSEKETFFFSSPSYFLLSCLPYERTGSVADFSVYISGPIIILFLLFIDLI